MPPTEKTTTTAVCSWCGRRLPAARFYADDTKRNGLSSTCRACVKTAARMRRLVAKGIATLPGPHRTADDAAAADFSHSEAATQSAHDFMRDLHRAYQRRWRRLRRQETLAYGRPLRAREREPSLNRQAEREARASRIAARRRAKETKVYGRPLTPPEQAAMLQFQRDFRVKHGYYPTPPQRQAALKSHISLDNPSPAP